MILAISLCIGSEIKRVRDTSVQWYIYLEDTSPGHIYGFAREYLSKNLDLGLYSIRIQKYSN
jgi:hypothetical protein